MREWWFNLGVRHPRVKGLVCLLPLLLPFLLLLPGVNAFPYPSVESNYSDLVITHFPNAHYLKQAIIDWQTVPLWSPTILSGYPFAANPLSGLWYPPGWLALFLPLPLGFNLIIGLHLVWGGLGAYLLLRNEGISYPGAMFGALAYEFMPKIFAHYGAGHLTLLYALAWTPWLLFSEGLNRSKDHQIIGGRIQLTLSDVIPAIVLGLIFLADVRWVLYAVVLWLAYSLVNRQNVLVILFQIVLGALISAPLALPLYEYTLLSTRVQMETSDVFTFSLPYLNLLWLFYPDFGGFHEWISYSGVVVVALGIISIVFIRRNEKIIFWVVVLVISVVLSLGSNIPGFGFLGKIPVIDLLRVPSRALFLTGFCMAVLAAYAVHYLYEGIEESECRRATLILFFLTAFVVSLAIGVMIISREILSNFAWGMIILTFGNLWVLLRLRSKLAVHVWYFGLILLCFIDWATINLSLYEPRSPEVVFDEGASLAAYMTDQVGRYRAYSPSYSFPQQTAAYVNQELADGVDPMQLKSYAEFMENATGVPRLGYGVTIPAFHGEDVSVANREFKPVPEYLGLLSVKYISSEFDLEVEGLELRERFGSTRLYENTRALPRAWIQEEGTTLGETVTPAEIKLWTANRITLYVDISVSSGDSQLILSEIYYPGWRVWVDGVPSNVEAIDGLLRGVRLEPGKHEVLFAYRPVPVYSGLVLCGMGILIVIYMLINRRNGHPSSTK